MKLLFLLIAVTAWGQSGIAPPAVVRIADAQGAVRTVFGLGGALVVGGAESTGVLSAACGAALCLEKTGSQLRAGAWTTDAPPGRAIFAFDGDRTLVYFVEPRRFAVWEAGALTFLDWQIDGEPLSMRLSPRGAEIAVRRDGAVWIVKPDGSVLEAIESTGPVLLTAAGILQAGDDGVLFQRDDGSHTRLDIGGIDELTLVSPQYALARGTNATYLIRIEERRENVFQIPLPANPHE